MQIDLHARNNGSMKTDEISGECQMHKKSLVRSPLRSRSILANERREILSAPTFDKCALIDNDKTDADERVFLFAMDK